MNNCLMCYTFSLPSDDISGGSVCMLFSFKPNMVSCFNFPISEGRVSSLFIYKFNIVARIITCEHTQNVEQLKEQMVPSVRDHTSGGTCESCFLEKSTSTTVVGCSSSPSPFSAVPLNTTPLA